MANEKRNNGKGAAKNAVETKKTGKTFTIKAPCMEVKGTRYSTKANTLYDAGYKVFRISASNGYLAEKVKVTCGGFMLFAEKDENGGIKLSANPIVEKKYQADNLARVKAIKDASFDATRTYLLNRHNFKSMKFETLFGKTE